MLFLWISVVLCWEAHIYMIEKPFFIVMRISIYNTMFPPACKYNWTGQELWQTHKCEYVM
jgi:hypothetical protein